MNKIIFRAQKRYSNEWVEGYFTQEPDGSTWIDHYPEGHRKTVEIKAHTLELYIDGNKIEL